MNELAKAISEEMATIVKARRMGLSENTLVQMIYEKLRPQVASIVIGYWLRWHVLTKRQQLWQRVKWWWNEKRHGLWMITKS